MTTLQIGNRPSISMGPLRIGNAGGVRLAGGGGVSYDADAVTLFAAMTTPPTDARKGLMNTVFVDLKAAGIYDKMDEFWVMAAPDSQASLLGWKRYKNLTAVNAPTFTTDRGYAGNGTTSYLDTNFVPSTDGVQYTLNDASLGVYSRTNSGVAGDDMAAYNATVLAALATRASDGRQYSGLNTLIAGAAADALIANSLGLSVSRRSASNAQQAYRNGSQIAASATASSALVSTSFYIGARNNNGVPAALVAREYPMAFVGAGMTPTQQLALFTIVEAYLDAIGAGVI